jgi:hypothetical protein
MLIATVLSLTLPATSLQAWSDRRLVAAITAGGPTFTMVGPADMFADRFNFARNTAAELMSYLTLSANWDGEGAVAISSDAVGNALDMLERVPSVLGAPKPMVLPSGEVALYWDHGDTYAEIGFDGTGTYYAYATRPGAAPVHLDDVPLLSESGTVVFPAEVFETLISEPLQTAA